MGRAAKLAFLLASVVGLAGCTGSTPTGSQAGFSAPSPAASTASVAPSAPVPGASARCSGQPTPAETEGPYFKAGSPERTSLVDSGMPGTRVIVSGTVLTLDCRPLSGVVLDFWQADASGVYDNAGYRLRGHLTSDSDGRYSLQTILPGEYPGRTQHIHVKVEAPGRPILTTQLYLPGSARNQQDPLFNPELLMQVVDAAGGKAATFDFVLNFR
jgi:protocatechuate 3,4-dioxygenase beta subunit